MFGQTVQQRIRWKLNTDDPVDKFSHHCRIDKNKHKNTTKTKDETQNAYYVNREVILEINCFEAHC